MASILSAFSLKARASCNEKKSSVVRAQAEVETAIKERDMAASRWDERVAQRKASIVKLRGELNDLKKQLAERPVQR